MRVVAPDDLRRDVRDSRHLANRLYDLVAPKPRPSPRRHELDLRLAVLRLLLVEDGRVFEPLDVHQRPGRSRVRLLHRHGHVFPFARRESHDAVPVADDDERREVHEPAALGHLARAIDVDDAGLQRAWLVGVFFFEQLVRRGDEGFEPGAPQGFEQEESLALLGRPPDLLGELLVLGVHLRRLQHRREPLIHEPGRGAVQTPGPRRGETPPGGAENRIRVRSRTASSRVGHRRRGCGRGRGPRGGPRGRRRARARPAQDRRAGSERSIHGGPARRVCVRARSLCRWL